VTIYWVVRAAAVAGGLCCAMVMKEGREGPIHVVALLLLAAGAFMDSQATNLTRPPEMYLSQAMIAFAGSLFLPPALYRGMMSALKKGPNYILSFVIVFLTTQSIGGLLGSAVLGSFITIREKFHSNVIVEHLAATDPQVALRLGQLGGAYAKVLTDKVLQNAEGAVLLAQQATREANVLAYDDVFLLIAGLALAALAVLLGHMALDAVRRSFAVPSPADA
jgi:hypothetical protein